MSADMEEEVAFDEHRMTLVEHLTELRTRIIRSVLAVAIGATIAWFFYGPILDALLNPYCDLNPGEPCSLFVTDPLEGFTTRLKITAYTGLALAMPVVLWQLWRFITPGLYPHEKKYAIPFVGSTFLLFLLGAGLAYWTMPKALEFLQEIGGPDLVAIYSPAKYLNLIVYMMLAFGIGFEFPILLVFLQMAGVVETSNLRAWRRYALVGIVVLVAVITPSGDPYSLMVLSVPMYLFYEGAIIFGWVRDRRRRRRAVEA